MIGWRFNCELNPLTPFSYKEKGDEFKTTPMNIARNRALVAYAKQLCRDLRKHQTKAEQIFWEAVRDRGFLGRKFYRQYPIFFSYLGKVSFFIADFYCHEARLVVEIDGKRHDYQKYHDALRTHVISELGIAVI